MPFFQDPNIYRDILDSLQIGVSVLDLQRKIVFWSDGAEKITGYSRIDVLGHSCRDNILLHCDQVRCEMCVEKCPLHATVTDGKAIETTSFIHHRAGHREPVHSWSIPLRDSRGSIIGIIQTFEGEFAVTGPNPSDQSMRARGCVDNLTGLPNQAMMHSHLREVLGTFAELHIPFGIVFLHAHDLAKFHARFGQLAGNAMLQVLARTLRNTVWSTDFVGRWNEDQFLVILPGCDEQALCKVGDRLVRMAASATIEWWGQELSTALSVGLASVQVGDSIESIVERAQTALPVKQVAENVPPPHAMGAAPNA
ncbi:MAG TPA: diguanylate cyclase [Candidatus Aquilonibacter sp.]|jgi:diguanylate cyclase (GGDEF)-like protein/PAS domain S-box-containing protein|nr:diguanylate cyclase [Candidatus Aquilonibacter sp.]